MQFAECEQVTPYTPSTYNRCTELLFKVKKKLKKGPIKTRCTSHCVPSHRDRHPNLAKKKYVDLTFPSFCRFASRSVVVVVVVAGHQSLAGAAGGAVRVRYGCCHWEVAACSSVMCCSATLKVSTCRKSTAASRNTLEDLGPLKPAYYYSEHSTNSLRQSINT